MPRTSVRKDSVTSSRALTRYKKAATRKSATNYDYFYIEAEILEAYQLVKKNINAIANSPVMSTDILPVYKYYRAALNDYHEINDHLVKAATFANTSIKLLESTRKLAPGGGDDDRSNFPKLPKFTPIVRSIKALTTLSRSRKSKLKSKFRGRTKVLTTFAKMEKHIITALKLAVNVEKRYKLFKKYIVSGRY